MYIDYNITFYARGIQAAQSVRAEFSSLLKKLDLRYRSELHPSLICTLESPNGDSHEVIFSILRKSELTHTPSDSDNLLCEAIKNIRDHNREIVRAYIESDSLSLHL